MSYICHEILLSSEDYCIIRVSILSHSYPTVFSIMLVIYTQTRKVAIMPRVLDVQPNWHFLQFLVLVLFFGSLLLRSGQLERKYHHTIILHRLA